MKTPSTLLIFSFLLSLHSNAAKETNEKTLTNRDLGLYRYEEHAEEHGSSIGKPIRVRVICRISRENPLVELLDKDDRKIPAESGAARQIHLIGLSNVISEMKQGEKYEVTGILLEDRGYYGSLVVYAREFNLLQKQKNP